MFLIAAVAVPRDAEAGRVPVEELVLPVLIQLAIIIIAARVFFTVFRRLGQPGVVGETVAGVLLGPSVFKQFFPQVWEAVFQPPQVPPAVFEGIFNTLSQLGLIFLLFLIGLEFDFSHLRWHGKSALSISLAGMFLPFGLGLLLAPLLEPYLENKVDSLGFALFMSTALSITAIPILGRIMMELNITGTRLGTITISASAVDDATGWILLAAVAAIVRQDFRPAATVWMISETIGFALAILFLVRPVLRWWLQRIVRAEGDLSLNSLAAILLLIFLCAIATNLIGIFAVFGAFILGASLSSELAFREAFNRRLRDLVTVLFLPIFFTYTGLRTNIGALGSAELWGCCGLVSLAAILGKLGGCGLAAACSGFSCRESCAIGAMMNTRGLMALIVINLGKDLGVVPDSVFCMLVLMALLTTMMTTPLLLWLMPGTELEPWIRASGFLRQKKKY